jgi:secreted trypsin-like serine protease
VGRSRIIAVVLLSVATLFAPAGTSSAWGASRIVGGSVAAPGQFPFMAFIVYFNNRGNAVFVCTGTLVSSNVVLTAGHCTANEKTGVPQRASGYRVVTGAVNWAKQPRTVSNVSKVRVNPTFNPHGPSHDAGLLILTKPVKQPAVQLWSSGEIAGGTAAQIAGWGETSPNSGPVNKLHWGPTVVQSANYCANHSASNFTFDPASMLCAQDTPSNHAATCNGDSGGPLLVKQGGVVTEVGLTSVGPSNCSTHQPDYYTAVRPIYPWVSSQINAYAP